MAHGKSPQAAQARPHDDTRAARVVLVDASSYLYRAYHAMPPLATSQGQPTGAVYGVVNMLRKLLADYQPEYVALVFDAKGRTFRDDLYAAYKAHRPRMPDDLGAQIAPLHDIIHAMGLPILMVEGVEADDVIGTLACQAAAAGMRALIVTSDKDFAQLVNEHITLVNTMNNSVLDAQGVLDKFGIPPARIIDYLALVGDSSDNVPGVPKVGPSTALKWLQRYETLDNIIAHAAEIGGKVGENLCACLDKLPVARALLTIKCDVALDVTPADLRPRAPDSAALRALYTQLEFTGWLKELLRDAAAPVRGEELGVRSNPSPLTPNSSPAQPQPPPVELITTPAQLEEWVGKLEQAEQVCFDLRTDRLDYLSARIVGLAFAARQDRAVSCAYVPLTHTAAEAPVQLERATVLERLRGLFENAERPKLGHDLKFAWHILANHGIHLAGARYDTMLESYVLDSTATRHDVDSLALKYLDGRRYALEDIAGKGARRRSFDQLAVPDAAACAGEHAALILRLHDTLWPELCKVSALQHLFEQVEMPLTTVLAHIERSGVRIDAAMLQRQSAELASRMHDIEEQAYRVAGQPFNLGSPLQIQEILYDKLGLPVLQKTPKGQPSTAEPVLQELALLNYDLPRLILEHRALSKLKSTYTDTLPQQIDPSTGRVHTCYHQAVTATGRLSSSDPNLQNIPIRTQEGRRIRQAFIPAPGYKILAADYSQIELRIMAHLSGDPGLLRAFAESADIHQITAAEVFGVPRERVTPDQRRAAKTINFGLIYGMSSFGLARQLGTDRVAAQHYVDRYFARYPGVKAYMDRTREQARQLGYVETVLGRRLYVPQIRDRNAQSRQYAERTAINAPMQGTAADIIKLAMLRVHAWLQQGRMDVKMIMQVHDELVFEVAVDHLEAAKQALHDCMAEVPMLSVPLVVDIGVGDNWDEAH